MDERKNSVTVGGVRCDVASQLMQLVPPTNTAAFVLIARPLHLRTHVHPVHLRCQ